MKVFDDCNFSVSSKPGGTVAPALHKRMFAEAFGTFWIVFAGTGAIVVGAASGDMSPVGVAIVFGAVVFAMIAALGDISGAHFNPAVTIGFYLAGRLPGKIVAPYIVAQLAGALLASGILHALMPAHPSLGETLPSGSYVGRRGGRGLQRRLGAIGRHQSQGDRGDARRGL